MLTIRLRNGFAYFFFVQMNKLYFCVLYQQKKFPTTTKRSVNNALYLHKHSKEKESLKTNSTQLHVQNKCFYSQRTLKYWNSFTFTREQMEHKKCLSFNYLWHKITRTFLNVFNFLYKCSNETIFSFFSLNVIK